MSFVIATDDLKGKFQEEFERLKESIKSPNILILGASGVGKSSLINTIFGKELAKVSNVKPETRGFHAFSDSSVPVTIIDSEGYELQETEKFKIELDKFIDSNFADITKQIHLVWYCVSLSSDRILQYDLDNISYIIDRKIPVCVVLTQCDIDTPEGDKAKALSNVVYRRFGNKVPCFQTSNDKSLWQELKSEQLIEWSTNNLSDDNLRFGFMIAQKINLDAKEEHVKKRIKYYTAGAAAIGGSPIPVSDAVLLTGLQVAMAADIFRIYGLDVTLSKKLEMVIGEKMVSMLGKMVAGNLIKLIPGIGTVAGALVNAGVASAITYSLGLALNHISRNIVEEGLEVNAELVEKVFTEENIQHFMDMYKSEK